MGYAMSRLEIDSDIFDDGNAVLEDCSSQPTKKPLNNLDNEISQLTKLKSTPHQLLGQVGPGRPELPVSPVKLLAGRESNYSGRGRFSSADCCHLLSRYLPVNGPSLIDQMASRVYVSQFSADGSLFVAGFQVKCFLLQPLFDSFNAPICYLFYDVNHIAWWKLHRQQLI